MGRYTRKDAVDPITNSKGYESAGVLIRRVCPACKKPKTKEYNHKKCSRIMQKMRERGDL